MSSPEVDPVRERLGTALRLAMRGRDRVAVSALRSAIAAIGNAEAVPVEDAPGAGAIETALTGVGAADAPRRVLSEADVIAIVREEISERDEAAAELDGLGREDASEPLRAGADLLREVLGEAVGPP